MASSAPTGVDIGSTSIRAVETSRSRDHVSTISNFSRASLPPGAVQGGVVHDEKAVTGILKWMWDEHQFRNKQIVLGVTSHQTVVREISLPNLPIRELRQSLPFQVRDMIPLAIDKALLDFYPLEKPGKSENIRGLLIAAPKELVLPMVNAVERAGLKVVRVDLASFAILRAAARFGALVEAIVDIGAHTTSVVIHVNGQPRIVRTIPRGGKTITDALANKLNIPVPEAEYLKRTVGLMSHQNATVVGVVVDAIRPLVSELRSSFEHVSVGETAARVQSIALCGGSALLPGLVAALGNEFGVEVFLADPLMRLRQSRHHEYRDGLAESRSSAAVSIGLALAAAA